MVADAPRTIAEPVTLAGPQFFANPYPLYAQIAASRAPVLDPVTRAWLVGDYTSVSSVLRDSRASKKITRAASTPFDQAILFRDPPDHTRSRAVMNHAFTSGVMDGLDQRILALTDGLIDRMLLTHAADFLSSFAIPLPVAVIADLLGVPPEDREKVHKWSAHMILDEGIPVEEGQMRQYQALLAMEDYIRRLLAGNSPEVQSGLIGALSRPLPSGDRLTEEELIGNCILLLVAGHETTVNLLGNGLHLLFQHPNLIPAIKSDTKLLSSLIEEVLRFESPVQQGTFRVTTEPIEIGGVTIPAGQQVTALIGAANRDPLVFPEPNRFDPTRTPNQHLAFGLGPHRCVGALLARMEAKIAFTRLIERLPKLAPGTGPAPTGWSALAQSFGLAKPPQPAAPQWRRNYVTRGLVKLDITY